MNYALAQLLRGSNPLYEWSHATNPPNSCRKAKRSVVSRMGRIQQRNPSDLKPGSSHTAISAKKPSSFILIIKGPASLISESLSLIFVWSQHTLKNHAKQKWILQGKTSTNVLHSGLIEDVDYFSRERPPIFRDQFLPTYCLSWEGFWAMWY